MIYGIFSDIHSNLPALEAVLASMSQHQVARRVCLGDLVGYCADADACVNLVRQNSDLCILGNHDSVALHREPSVNFNQYARIAIEWTQKHLSKDSMEFMKKLPYILEEGDLCFVHASPKSPADWSYIASLDEADDAFEFFTSQVCLVGHTHSPVIVVRGEDGIPMVIEDDHYRPGPNQRLLVNVGSVGQPRDRNPEACWCRLDTSDLSVSFIRVPYDIGRTQEAMRREGFPAFLIQRIAEGR
ncbi:MAG TPA: metallophosphoesterase family protein [Fibrobacteraceae bacterium]|nr:metallophosphoesterase family protein [Fibrobacteraceae bacterium]